MGSWIKLIDGSSKILSERRYVNTHEEIVSALCSYNPIPNPGVMFRKSVVLLVGGYGTQLPEDYDLWFKMLGHGKFYNVPEFLTSYRIHPQGSKMNTARLQQWGSLQIRWDNFKKGKVKLGFEMLIKNGVQIGLLLLPAPVVLLAFRIAIKMGMIR